MDLEDENLGIELSDSEVETMTAQKVLEKLEEAWQNEKLSPELLEHQTDIVECMLEQIQQMEQNLEKLKRTDFRLVVHTMELDRVRFLLTSYLRIRLEKIERYTAYIFEQESRRSPSDPPLMSAEEQKFAREYEDNLVNYFHTLALRHMPSNLENYDKAKTMVSPNLDCLVVLRVNRSVTSVVIESEIDDQDDEIDLENGTQHIMKYRPVGHLVKSSDVQLI